MVKAILKRWVLRACLKRDCVSLMCLGRERSRILSVYTGDSFNI